MARVTVEDCISVIPNKFELVLLASKRARDIERGATPSIPKENDKPTIIALREIADQTISLDGLREIAKRSTIEDDSELLQTDLDSRLLDIDEATLFASAEDFESEDDEDEESEEELDDEDIDIENTNDEITEV